MDNIDKAITLVMAAGFEPGYILEGACRVVICATPVMAADDPTVFSVMHGGDTLRAVFVSPTGNDAAMSAVSDFWANR